MRERDYGPPMLFAERRQTSPRSLPNRRSYEVMEYLSVAARAPMVFPGEDGQYPSPMDDAHFVMACVDAADAALRLAIDTAADGTRWSKRFYKAYTTDTGPAAVVVFGLGLAAIELRFESSGAGRDRQLRARNALTATFGPDPDTDRLIDDMVAQIDPETAEGLMDARIDLARATAGVVLGADAAAMPGFAAWYDGDEVEEYAAGMSWQICFNHATTAWLLATDPERLQG